VDDPLGVGRLQTARRLDRVAQDLANRRSSPRDELPEVLTLQKLRDDVGRALVRAHVVDGEDVRMVERGDGTSLALEQAETLRIPAELLREHLDGDVASEAGVPGPIHLPHAARPEELDHLVGPQPRAPRTPHDSSLCTAPKFIRLYSRPSRSSRFLAGAGAGRIALNELGDPRTK
jgi:hypothetical protein